MTIQCVRGDELVAGYVEEVKGGNAGLNNADE